jgi:hypothetical protein
MSKNQFLETFEKRILGYWDDSIENGEKLEADIVKYANENREQFVKDIQDIKYVLELDAFTLILDLLTDQGEQWGSLMYDTLDEILTNAYLPDQKVNYLYFLTEFVLFDFSEAVYLQKLVDRLGKELDSENEKIRLAAINAMPLMMDYPNVRNKSNYIELLQHFLTNGNRKERLVAFTTLDIENLLPTGYIQPFKDKVLRFIYGQPTVF